LEFPLFQITNIVSSSDIQTLDLDDDEWTSDINVVASTIKLWLRELPEPLLTFGLFQGFVDAASEWANCVSRSHLIFLQRLKMNVSGTFGCTNA
jgi:hypothetical protein